MRVQFILLLAIVGSLSCRSAKSMPEPGAVLVHLLCTSGSPNPDELRAWVYDDRGILWDGARIPAEGPWKGNACPDLGTVLIQPGTTEGALRIHIQALAAGIRILDGVLLIPSVLGTGKTFDLLLKSTLPSDTDGDTVPDGIDNCPGAPNPLQKGCLVSAGQDGGNDTITRALLDAALVLDSKNDSDVGSKVDRISDGLTIDSPILNSDAGSEGGVGDRVDAAKDKSVDAISPDTAVNPACEKPGLCNMPQGALCASPSECASGACADGVCCDNSCIGACRSCNQPSGVGICQGYPADTDPMLECSNGSMCNGLGACGPVTPPTIVIGEACIASKQCLSGFCVDGVCCNTACTGACKRCATGKCLAVKKADDPPRCTGTKTCNPQGECVDKD